MFFNLVLLRQFNKFFLYACCVVSLLITFMHIINSCYKFYLKLQLHTYTYFRHVKIILLSRYLLAVLFCLERTLLLSSTLPKLWLMTGLGDLKIEKIDTRFSRILFAERYGIFSASTA